MSSQPKFRPLRCCAWLLLFAALGNLVLPLPADAAGLVEGLRKYEAGDYAGAIGEWQPLADRGDPDALFNLGQVYRLGRGVAVDGLRAADYYRRAGEAGHAGARGALATIYYYDHGTRQKRGQAIALWRLAAAAGDAPSQYILAVLHFNGQDVPKDLTQAYAWALLAAEGGLAEGQTAAQSIGAHLSPNQLQQARVLKGGLFVSTPAPQPAPPPVRVAEAASEVAEPEIAASPEPEQEPQQEPQPEPEQVEAALVETGGAEEVMTEEVISEAWSVQLGFYSQRHNAVEYWARVAPRVEEILPGARHDILTLDRGPERGIFYRLLAGSFALRADASSFCNDLKSIGIDCVIVKP